MSTTTTSQNLKEYASIPIVELVESSTKWERKEKRTAAAQSRKPLEAWP
jgi:hypothetical protein